jgi:hypothetical protein
MQSKYSQNLVLATNAVGPVNVNTGVQLHSDFAIQVNYNAGGSGDLKLQGSVDGVNFADIPNSTQTVDGAGGAHIWDCFKIGVLFIRVVVPAITASEIRIVGSRLELE